MGLIDRTTLVRAGRRIHRCLLFPVLAFVLPSVCFGCREPLGAVQRMGACSACWTGLRILPPWSCPGCGLPRSAETDLLGPVEGRCATCVLSPPGADRVRAAVAYDGIARALLLRAKIGKRRELFEPLSAHLTLVVRDAALGEGCSAVVAVPSHPLATLKRGFSPAVELARPLSRRLELPLLGRALYRGVRIRPATKRLGARRRKATGSIGFGVRGRLDGMRLLLVDDVMTTGSTVNACARLLKHAGAVEVRVAVWARTLPHHPSTFDRGFSAGS